jgi:hypothetical protein
MEEGIMPDVMKGEKNSKRRVFLYEYCKDNSYELVVGEKIVRSKVEMIMTIYDINDVEAYKQASSLLDSIKIM